MPLVRQLLFETSDQAKFCQINRLAEKSKVAIIGRGQVTDLGGTVLHFSGLMKSGHFPWNCPPQFQGKSRKGHDL